MTAKSETVGVVAWQSRSRLMGSLEWTEWVTLPDYWDGIRLPGFEYRALVPESALAELAQRQQEEHELSNAAIADEHRVMLLWKESAYAEREKLRTILSGLEALAKECLDSSKYAGYTTEERQVYIDMTVKLRALIPAAANTESEELKP